MSRVLRLRAVDIGFAVYGNDKERVAEAAIQIRRREAKSVPAAARRDERKEKRNFSLRRPTLHKSKGKEKFGLLRSVP